MRGLLPLPNIPTLLLLGVLSPSLLLWPAPIAGQDVVAGADGPEIVPAVETLETATVEDGTVTDMDLDLDLDLDEDVDLAAGAGGPEMLLTPSQLYNSQLKWRLTPEDRMRGRYVRGKLVKDLELTLPQYGVTEWAYPISDARETGSPFGWRISPIDHIEVFHPAQDIGCRHGEPIYASADGVVRISKFSASAGNYVEIDHGEFEGKAVVTRYLHLSQRFVEAGDEVARGRQVGRCGNTGRSTSSHLHFAIWHGEVPVPPFALKLGVE